MYEWKGNKISSVQHQILLLLYQYRGLPNGNISRIIYGHLPSKKAGQKANVSRYVSGLKKLKLIKSSSCHPYSQELMNYLTQDGIDYLKQCIPIEKDIPESGFGHVFGDFDAELLKPPQKLIKHFMLFADLASFAHNHEDFDLRHNMYAVREFTYTYYDKNGNQKEKKGKVKPDGELSVWSRNQPFLVSVELDTGSECRKQLVNKFIRYRRYFEYTLDNGDKIPYGGILFYTKEGTEKKQLEKDIRWKTIVSAAAEGLSYLFWKVPVYKLNQPHSIACIEKMCLPFPPKEKPVEKKSPSITSHPDDTKLAQKNIIINYSDTSKTAQQAPVPTPVVPKEKSKPFTEEEKRAAERAEMERRRQIHIQKMRDDWKKYLDEAEENERKEKRI